MKFTRCVLSLIAALIMSACVSYGPAWPDAADEAIIIDVDKRADLTAELASDIWDWAELGYHEEKSSGLLQSTLIDEGFTVEAGVAGIPTAFVAEYGAGGPVIAILAEFDALPGLNQSRSPQREEVPGKGAGHACGHNLFGAGSVTAAISIRHWLEKTGTPGRIRVYGTPAEEGGSGKVYMVREGLFDDVDIAMHWHAAGLNTVFSQKTLALRSAKFRFHGVSAHAAASPEQAHSALDGVEAFNMMVNMMREHIPQESRVHYVITEGGSAPNVVPDFAEVYYYVRHPSVEGVEDIWAKLENAARGAALGTGTSVSWEIIHGSQPLLVNEALAEMMDEKLHTVGGVTYTPEEQAYAEKIAATLEAPYLPVGTETDVQPYRLSQGYASTDVGDVSYAAPTVGILTATWVAGTPAHSWQAVAASGSSIGYKGAQVAAKTLTLAAIELYTNRKIREKARAEFEAALSSDYKYISMVGDREPPLDFRE